VQTHRTSVREAVVPDNSFEALAAAHSRAAARLSQGIAEAVRALQGMSVDTVQSTSDMRM
jgi:hypothetical protein